MWRLSGEAGRDLTSELASGVLSAILPICSLTTVTIDQEKVQGYNVVIAISNTKYLVRGNFERVGNREGWFSMQFVISISGGLYARTRSMCFF